MKMVWIDLLVAFLIVDATGSAKWTLPEGWKLRHRYVARVMYDGTGFRGWQEQLGANMRTVQGVVSHRLSKRFNTVVRATGASRTDLGVHARGQAIHFEIPEPCNDLEKLEYTINRMLPDDVKLFNISNMPIGTPEQEIAGEPWHATASATGKLYLYRFCTNTFVDPTRRRYCAHVYQPTDIEILKKCLEVFVGTHDFRAYANRIERLEAGFQELDRDFTTTRTIHSINLTEDDHYKGYYTIAFHLESALYRMVRNIVGSSLSVAQGGSGIDFELMQKLLHEGCDRKMNKAMPAPPEGLTLEHVYYHHY